MTTPPHSATPQLLATDGLAPPPWATDLLGTAPPTDLPPDDGIALTLRQADRFCLLTARLPRAAAMDDAAFEQGAARTYALIARHLAASRARHPVRFWNRVPGILNPAGNGLNRYMVFNAGRYQAYQQWYGAPAAFDTAVATASGVGHDGDDLVVHALAADTPGRPVANPRQVPPFRYSRCYGPRPPCFARATLLAGPPRRLLVGGTASVRGEATVHVGNLPAQLDETFLNLAALIASCEPPLLSQLARTTQWSARNSQLSRYRDLRIYHRRPDDAESILHAIRAAFPALQRIELIRADLCRPDLLVEIEGLAHL